MGMCSTYQRVWSSLGLPTSYAELDVIAIAWKAKVRAQIPLPVLMGDSGTPLEGYYAHCHCGEGIHHTN